MQISSFLDRMRANSTFETRAAGRIGLVFVGLFLLAALMSGGVFLQPANLLNLGFQNVILLVVSLGQLIVILTGGIDLSVGAVHALCGVIIVLMQDVSLPVALLIAVGVAALLGALSGSIVTYVRLPSFVVTLGVAQIVTSLAMVIGKGGTVYTGLRGAGLDPTLIEFYKGSLLGVPKPLVFGLLACVVFALLLRTSYGHFTYAVGGNRRAAFLSGIPVRRVQLLVFILSSVIAGVSGALFVARVGLGDPQAGRWLALDSIAAVSIGGASLSGGTGTVIGTLFGVVILSVLNNIMNLIGVPPTLQPAIKGVVILLAVFLNSVRKRS
jgi:ribose transport system permease protein